MLEAFREWFQKNAVSLEQNKIRVELSEAVAGSSNDSIHADLETEKYGATVQLWQDGQSDFSFVEWEAADDPSDVQVTHYDFQNEDEVYTALHRLVKRMGEDKTALTRKNWPVSGYSETVYVEHPAGDALLTHAAKGKSR